MENFSAHYS